MSFITQGHPSAVRLHNQNFRVLFSQSTSPEPMDDSEDETETFSPLPEPGAADETESTSEEPVPTPTEQEGDPETEATSEEPVPTPAEQEGDPETEADDTSVNEETEAESDTEIRPTASGESIPIPTETVLDELEYLDPDPNPLLIQTQPEEVEIIGTQPISLEEAVELAYRNNPDLQIAALELEQSEAALREAQAARFPTFSVNSTLQGQNTTESSSSFVGGTLQTESSESLGASLSAQADLVYNIFSSGERAASIRAAEEQVKFNELEVERRREELRINTANEYYDLQTAIESIRINQAFLEEAERNLRDTSLREEVGVGTRFDVLRAEVQVANARQDLVNAERDRQVAQRTLAQRLNVPPSLTITTVPVEVAGNWPLTLEESIVLAYQNRAELEQQLVQRDLNEQLRRVDLSVLGPQVDLFATYQTSDILTQDGGFEDNYQFGARVAWTLFEGGAARARARQREIEGEIAENSFEENRNIIRLSVESAYYNLQSNFINIDTATLAVEQAQEALDLAILRFDAGVGTQLEILEAQSELTDAEVNLVQAKVGYNRSLAEMERAVSNIAESYYEDLPY
ncbi:MAG: TolC family protein [Leptolyngbya sp. SIO1D8]|nr:TolC family protein [Leptolyngbya sp. SIO1D8]